MRLEALRLIAFGPFTDVTLDLSRPGLQLVYGPNEAGKSTSLRAITALCYGIPTRTPDAHLHGNKGLRVGGTITTASDVLEIVRRKGQKNTLHDAQERPVDEARLTRALGGVGRELFLTMFGLDHVTLRDAAQALLQGEGDVGESLFDAGGARGIGATLRALRDDADTLFKARGQTQQLNEALRAHAEARKSITIGETLPRAYLEQQRAVEDAQRERERIEVELRGLVAERKRLERAIRVMPRLAAHGELSSQLAQLGDVPRLADDARTRRLDAERALAEATRDAERLQDGIAESLARRGRLDLDEALADLDEAFAKQLEKLEGRHRSALDHMPKRRSSLAAHREEAGQLLQRLGRRVTLDDVESLRLDDATRKRIEELSKQRSGLVANCDNVERRLRECRARRDDAARSGVIAQRMQRRLGSLGRVDLDAVGLDDLGVPAREIVEEHAARWRAHAAAMKQLAERRASVASQHERVQQGRDELDAFAVPTEAALVEARAERDGLWKKLRRGIAGGKPLEPDAYERSVGEADEIADRLRREAERVARRARLDAEHASLLRAADEIVREEAASSAEGERLRKAWHDAWRNVDAGSPEQMIPWLDRYERVVADRDALEEQHAELQVDIATLEGEHAVQRDAMERWENAWAAAMARLGLAPDAQVGEAEIVLEGLRQLFEKLKDVRTEERRIEGIERDATEFEALARPTVTRLLPALAEQPIDDAVAELLERSTKARNARADAANIDSDIAAKRAELADMTRRRQAAQDVLVELARAAGVEHPEQLEALEQLAERRAGLEQRLRDAELALFEEGESIAQLRELCAHVDRDLAAERVAELERETERLNDALTAITEQIGRDSGGLGLYQKREGAYDAADRAQACLATVRRLAERYAKVKLASVILEREVERYREANQGPIIRRAGELFPRLTLGEYRQLRVDYDAGDAPELRCVRVDGSELGVGGLSDGARDQLYLALRLASLERYAEQAELMPFVADDILIHFDEDRARAAIEVLDEFCNTTQVLMFTHHARVVELARAALPAGRLTVHELGPHRGKQPERPATSRRVKAV